MLLILFLLACKIKSSYGFVGSLVRRPAKPKKDFVTSELTLKLNFQSVESFTTKKTPNLGVFFVPKLD